MENSSPTPDRPDPVNRRRSPEEIEAFIHRTLRALPPRRAPFSLENRVLATIAAREALPWWKKSYASWPQPVQLAFFVFSAALAAVIVWVGLRFVPGLEVAAVQPVESSLGWLASTRALFATVGDALGRALPAISPLWIYGGLAFVGAAYATLMGLGAAAYRYLWQGR